jgi:hypothetical protein
MVDIKEIKHIRAAPFTLMSSSIHAILAFIAAILIVLFFGSIAAFIPGASSFAAFITVLGLAIIILYPLTAFFWNILLAFVTALYKPHKPKVGYKMVWKETIKSIPSGICCPYTRQWYCCANFIIGLNMDWVVAQSFHFSVDLYLTWLCKCHATNTTNATFPTGGVSEQYPAYGPLFWIFLGQKYIHILIHGYACSPYSTTL